MKTDTLELKKPISLYLISGFLGSGKTTFLQSMLEKFPNRKTGVIVNEFGSISIDGKVLQNDDIKMVEISNGSIFCACLKGGFVKTLIAFSRQPIDVLFIENSGMADPSNMQTLLRGAEKLVARPYEYKGSVCLADATSFTDYIDMFSPMQNQVAVSSLVLVNKTDLVSPDALEEIHEIIHDINENAYIVDTTYSEVSTEVLERELFASDYEGETTNKPWNRPATYSIVASGTHTREGINAFVESFKGRVIRMKGFIKLEKGYVHVNVVGDYLEMNDHPDEDVDETTFVVIGKDTQEFSDELIHNWKKYLGSEPEIID